MMNTPVRLAIPLDSARIMRARQFLVTGGTGFIGRHVVGKLLQRGDRVRLFCRHPEKARRLFGDRVELVVGDLRAPASVRLACRGVAVVLHVGGVYRFGRGARAVLWETNVRGTEFLLAAVRAAGVERFVHVSSSAVLAEKGGQVAEESFPDAVSPREPYRHSKWLSEQAALAAARAGLPVVITNPSCPIGIGDENPTPTGRIIQDFVRGKFPLAAHVGLNFLHVGELADGILSAADHGRVGERYLLGHHNVWLDDFLRLLARCTHRRAPLARVPQPLIALAGLLGEVGGSDRVCWETAAHAQRCQWFDCHKAAQELGWQPSVPIEVSAREAVDWFQRQAAAAA